MDEQCNLVVSGFSKLSVLDMSECGLDDWSQVVTFSQLPNLKELVLDGNLLHVSFLSSISAVYILN